MVRTFWKYILTVSLVLFATQAWAQTAQYLVVPECMLSKKFQYDLLAKSKDLRLIRTTQFSEFQIERVKQPFYCRGFFNVTEAWHASKTKDSHAFLEQYLPDTHPSDFTRGYKIQYKTKVNALLQNMEPKSVWTDLKFLTGLPNRYVNSNNGVYAAQWIKQQLKTMTKEYAREDVSVYTLQTINHARQPSVIMKIGKDSNEPGIVIGAHLDTIDSTHEYQPGADDDASGVVTILETARILLSSELRFKKPIYLIFYSGEEAGKLGSQSVVQNFNQNNIAVDSVLQLDETGYVGNEQGIGLTDDFTDAGLSAFVADLVGAYVRLPVGAVRCGFACSDHVTWYKNGTRVAYPFTNMTDEGNPHIHTRRDTVDTLSLNHIMDFVRLSVGFAVELAEPV